MSVTLSSLPPWSHTAIETYEQCPRKYYHKFIAKDIVEKPSQAMLDGRRDHDALEKRLKDGVALPEHLAQQEPLCRSIISAKQGAKLYTELKMGLTRELEPCAFFDKTGKVNARSALDVGIHKDEKFALMDWKTGKKKEFKDQLEIMSAFIFRHFPKVMRVVACNIWLQTSEVGHKYIFHREQEPEIWQKIIPKVQKKSALEKARSQLKKAEHVNTPLSIKRKLKKKEK